MWRAKFDFLPGGLALLGLGVGTAGVTFGSLAAADVSDARTQLFALISLLLAAPAIVLFAIEGKGDGDWWRSFWTVGLFGYLLHFWWALMRSYDGSIHAIVQHQGWVAYSNFVVTALWSADVAIAWLITKQNTIVTWLHAVTWFMVSASFIVASALFRSGPIAMLGYGLLLAIAAGLFKRGLVLGFGVEEQESTDT